MPNIKSAKKRVLVINKKTEQNKSIRSAVKTEIKKVDVLIKENKLEEAKAALSLAFSAIDSACSKNIYHANNASNKKSKLAKKVGCALASATPAVEEEVVAPVEEVKAPVEEEVKPVKKTTAKKATAEDGEKKPAKKTTTKKATAEDSEKKPATRKPRAKKAE